MPYIGNTVQNQGFAPAIDYFSGDGVTVTFTLSRPIASVAQVIVAIDNVIQNPSSSFTVAGNSITFTSAPLSGTNNIWVEYTSLITTYAAISQDPTVIGDIRATGGYLAEGDFGNSYIDGTIVDYVTGNARITTGPIDNMTFYHGGTSGRSEMMELYYAGGAKIFGTTALTIPVGTTAQRPTGATGMIRYNTTTNVVETYNGSSWVAVGDQRGPYTVEYLVVAGGGGGGGNYVGGGGGAGGLIDSSTTLNANTSYTVTIGAGGAGGGTSKPSPGSSGSNSVFDIYTAIGGGFGGTGNSGTQYAQAGNGGSGGGSGAWGSPTTLYGSGTAGQGNRGGSGMDGISARTIGGGGGGAGAVGGDAASGIPQDGGAGGAGINWKSLGTFYAGGGGGGTDIGGGVNSGSGGTGGSGGGGNGGTWSNTSPTAGTANTGGGGGGNGREGSGASGGSGIVIIRYFGSQRGTGGTVTSSGGYTYHTFTTSGTYTA